MYAFPIFLCFTISPQTNNYPLFQSVAFKSWPIICSLLQTIRPAGGQNATKMTVSYYGPASTHFFFFWTQPSFVSCYQWEKRICNSTRQPRESSLCPVLFSRLHHLCCTAAPRASSWKSFNFGSTLQGPDWIKVEIPKKIQKLIYSYISESHKLEP